LKDTKIINKYQNLSKLKNNSSGNLKYIDKISKSTSGNQLYNLMPENKNSTENIAKNQNNNFIENLNNIPNYISLLDIWTEFNISEPYKNYFNIILNKLSDEEKEELCLKELKELSEIKNNIFSLIKEINLRKEILTKLFKLNNLLNRDLENESNSPDNMTLKEISEQILNQKKVINEIAAKVVPDLAKKKNEQKVGNEANEYFNELDKYANLYLNIYDKCKKGEEYYNNLQYKVDEVLAASNQWMIKRNEEKNALISALTKGFGNNGSYAGQSSQYQDSSAYLNPNENMYTNFSVNTGNRTGGGYKGSY
jgi:hypothetical protein